MEFIFFLDNRENCANCVDLKKENEHLKSKLMEKNNKILMLEAQILNMQNSAGGSKEPEFKEVR